MTTNEIFKVHDPDHRRMLIEGLQPVVTQFFRHYGHSIRERQSYWAGGRLNEVVLLVFVFCLLVYFPFGLVLIQHMDEKAWYIWLVYQMYAVIAMHVIRIMGWQDIGGTEQCIAKLLSEKRTVWLHSSGGSTVSASLSMYKTTSTLEGKVKVKQLLSGACEQT